MAHRELEWKCIASDPGPDLKLFKARFDHMKNPRNEKIERMIILESADSANVVSITPKREILFVEQYRFGISSLLLSQKTLIISNSAMGRFFSSLFVLTAGLLVGTTEAHLRNQQKPGSIKNPDPNPVCLAVGRFLSSPNNLFATP